MANDKDVALSVKLSADDTEIQKALAGLKANAERSLHDGLSGASKAFGEVGEAIEKSQINKALAEIATGTKVMADQFGEAAANAHRALDTIGLGAEAQVPRLQRMTSGFQSFTGKLGQGINAIDGFAKSLGPWNQALEVGGKAIKFVGDGLDAYAKTSPAAAAEVQKLTAEFGHLKESAMAAFGEMAVEVLKPLPSLKEINAVLADQQRMFERIEALKAAGGGAGDVFHELAAESRGAGALAHFLSGDFVDDVKTAFSRDTWSTFNVDDALGHVKAGLDATRRATDAATAAAVRNRRERERENGKRPDFETPPPSWTQNQTSPTELQKWLGEPPETTTHAFGAAIAGALGSSFKSITDGGAEVVTTIHAIERAAEDMGPTLLERLGLQDPEAWDTALAAAQGFSSALQSSLRALGEDTMSGGEVFKKGVGIIVSALGDKLAANASAEFVAALASAVLLDPLGAAQHFAAGTIYSGGAVAAYAAATKLGGPAGSIPSSSGGGAAAGGGAGSGDGHDHRNGGGGPLSETKVIREMIVAYASPFEQATERMKKRQAELVVQRATGGQAWSND